MNCVILAGNVCATPKVVRYGSGKRIVHFKLATNRWVFKDPETGKWKKETDFHHIVAKGRFLSAVSKLPKGSPVTVRGSVVYVRYTTKDGKTKRRTQIHVQQITPAQGRSGTATKKHQPVFIEAPDDLTVEELFQKLDGV